METCFVVEGRGTPIQDHLCRLHAAKIELHHENQRNASKMEGAAAYHAFCSIGKTLPNALLNFLGRQDVRF